MVYPVKLCHQEVEMPTLSEEIVDEVQKRSAFLEDLPGIRMVAISLGYTFVELSNGTMGVCFTPRSDSESCAHYPRAGTLAKKHILDLTELMLSPQPLEKSVGIAAVNAVSQMIMDQEPDHYPFSETDFLNLLPFGDQRLKVGMVGNIGRLASGPGFQARCPCRCGNEDHRYGARRAILEGGGTPHFISCGCKYTLTNQGKS
jgi:hypothetical protein